MKHLKRYRGGKSREIRIRKYTDRQILKIPEQPPGIYLIGIRELLSFQTLTRRARMFVLHAIDVVITFL